MNGKISEKKAFNLQGNAPSLLPSEWSLVTTAVAEKRGYTLVTFLITSPLRDNILKLKCTRWVNLTEFTKTSKIFIEIDRVTSLFAEEKAKNVVLSFL